jgi:hypothetical protein
MDSPMTSRANKQWSWHYILRLGLSADRDIGIVLRSLCVVDIGCHTVGAELCAHHPVLLSTARATNHKGMHFFFKRSKVADQHGYYDGAAQKLVHVDFKTICSDGAPGFLVVAPSSNMQWVVAPWDLTELPEIPDDLLQAVALPRHRAVTATVKMVQTGEIVEYRDSTALGRLTYTSMFEEMPEIPVPIGDAETMSSLIDAMDIGRIRAQSEEFVARVLRLGDFMGMRIDDLHAIEARTRESMRLWAAYPEAARVVEHLDGGSLVDVAEVADSLRFQDIDLGSDAVLPCDGPNVQKGEAVIVTDCQSQMEASLPETIRKLLSRYQSRLIIAGGFVTGEVTHYGAGNDIDLFVTGCTVDEANAIVEAFLSQSRVRLVCRTANAVTFDVNEGHIDAETIPVQIVLTLYDDPAAVLRGFDLDPCRACAYYRGSQLHVLATASWIRSMTTASYPVRSERWTMSSTARIIKYTIKGFQAYVPGLDRTLVPVTKSAMLDFTIAMQTSGGVQELVQAERAFFWQHGEEARLTYNNVRGLMSCVRISRRHDYDAVGLCGNLLKSLYQRGALLDGSQCDQLEAGKAAALLTWKPPLAGRGLNAYFPAVAGLNRVVNTSHAP